ncbi:aldehyde dehydrogenase family protein [Microbacterium sp. MYb62]|uniref:aldehyde dehydrogenase family protein n=1 Tax=Microbacterium sp. MYb62 TaxID=1848690 RepID=UPI0015E3244F|nr:aldehyde dehydrogenase family protein [Microbacterium sp. MYb62]
MNVRNEELDLHESAIASHHWTLSIGSERRPGRGNALPTLNPSTSRLLAEVASASADDVDDAVSAAVLAAQQWGERSPLDRARLVRDLADVLESHAEELAWLDTLDAGLPLWMMRVDVATGLQRMRMFSDFALGLTGQTIPASAGGVHLTFPRPFGVVARIIPFNHPFMFAASKLAAPLMAGNAVILKPSEQTPLSALRLGELAQGVLPDGVLSVLHGGPPVGERMVRNEAVRRIAFTGSHIVGREIQRIGAESGVKHISLELGGKNAMIVFDDADMEAAVAGAVKGMNFAFVGQSCGSTSRILLHRSVAERFTELFVKAVDDLRVGAPWESDVQVGPMVDAAARQRVEGFIERASAAGAVRLTADRQLPDDGGFVAPTVFRGVDPRSELGQEEVFGPVVSLFTFTEESEAIALANDVRYGLTASVWTNDLSRSFRMARALEAGYIWINDTSTHFPGVPFGGTKLSGAGREESIDELLSYTETTAVNVVMAR